MVMPCLIIGGVVLFVKPELFSFNGDSSSQTAKSDKETFLESALVDRLGLSKSRGLNKSLTGSAAITHPH